jgi:hypothetical protein
MTRQNTMKTSDITALSDENSRITLEEFTGQNDESCFYASRYRQTIAIGTTSRSPNR